MTDHEFIDGFAAGRLDPAGFDHRAHLRAAFLLVFARAVGFKRRAGALHDAGPLGRRTWLRK